jgi:membrane protease YdiL (CAAX protease family)
VPEQAVEHPAHRSVPEFLRVPWPVSSVVLMIVIWIGLQVGIAVVLQVLAGQLPAVREFLHGVGTGQDIQALLILDLVEAALGFGIVWGILRRYHAPWSALGWRYFDVPKALVYLVGVMVLFVAVSAAVLWLVSRLIPGFNANQAQDNEFIGLAGQHRALALFALVLLPPILEETIFRGFMFPAMAKRWGVPAGAVISSIIFGVAHWQANISIYTFLLGLLLCAMYVKLKSIIPGMGLHMLNNYLAFLALTGSK